MVHAFQTADCVCQAKLAMPARNLTWLRTVLTHCGVLHREATRDCCSEDYSSKGPKKPLKKAHDLRKGNGATASG